MATEKDDEFEDCEMTEEEKEREEQAREDWELENDPYSDDEKEQMGSSEFFYDND